MARFVRCLPLLLLVVALAGCVKYEEHIEIDANGKGKATLSLHRPKRGMVDKMLFRARGLDNRFAKEALTENLPAGVTAEWQEVEKDERIEIRVVYTYDDINKLLGWAARNENQHPLNNVSVTRQGTTLEFTRRFSALEKEEMEGVQKYAADAPVVFKLTGPGTLKGHNATRVDGTTAVWEYKVPELFPAGGKNFNATYFFGTPPLVYILIVAGLIVAAIVVLKIVKKKPNTPVTPAA